MKVFIGNGQNWQEEVKKIYQTPYLPPFSKVVLDFLQQLSREILQNKQLRTFPELIALGYWLRKGNIAKLADDFAERTRGKVIKPRGVALHFAPSNVDTIFVYSLVLSLLAGNKNIIRISQKENESLLKLVDIIRNCLQDEAFQEIKERLFICSYEHDEKITAFLSNYCHIRVIWGGDQTVKTIRAIPLAPLANELVFANRFSLVALSAEAIVEAEADEFIRFLNHFYNDAFTFDQMACSSPRLVIWTGEKAVVSKAKEKFWNRLEQLVKEKNYQVAPAVNMNRLVTTFYYAAHDYAVDVPFPLQTKIKRITINELSDEIRTMHCGAGLFLEYQVEKLTDAANILADQDQTLAYYGFTREELLQFVEQIKNRAIDRIVPVGEALNFSKVWDGADLLISFTREIEITWNF